MGTVATEEDENREWSVSGERIQFHIFQDIRQRRRMKNKQKGYFRTMKE